MNTKLARALAAAEIAQEKGELTFKLAAWVGAAWVSFAAEAVVQLADPHEAVDKGALSAMLETSWERARAVIDDVPMGWFAKFMWTAARSTVPSVLPSVVAYLAEELDKGENH